MKPKRVVSLLVAGCMAVSMVPASAVTAFAETVGNVPSITAPNASETIAVTVTVSDSGQLENAVSTEATRQGIDDISTITKLTVVGGPLNATDFQFMSGVKVTEQAGASGKYSFQYAGAENYEGEQFSWLSGLKELDLSAAIFENNEIPPHAFRKNDKIEKIILPETLERIRIHGFSSMSSLNYLGTSAGNLKFPASLKILGAGAFFNDKNLTEKLTIPENVTAIGAACFQGSGIGNNDSVTIPKNVQIIENIDAEDGIAGTQGAVFQGTTNIREFVFEDGITEIGSAFANESSGLKNIVIPNSVRKIGNRAFRQTGLTGTVIIPVQVEEIGNSAFAKCSSVDNFIVENPNITLSQYSFANMKEGAKLYFTSDTVPANTNEYWSGGDAGNQGVVVLATAGGKIDPSKLVDETTGLYTPEKEGYTFTGWYDANGNELKTAAAKNNTYTAKWGCTVSFETNGHGTKPADVVVEPGQMLSNIPSPGTDNTEGWVFDGWYLDAGFNHRFTTTEIINQNITVYAKWHEFTNTTVTATASKDGEYLLSEPVEIDFKVNIGDDIYSIKNLSLEYGDEVESVKLNGTELEKDKKDYTTNDLLNILNQKPEGTLTVTYNKTGKHTFGVILKDLVGKETSKASVDVTVVEMMMDATVTENGESKESYKANEPVKVTLKVTPSDLDAFKKDVLHLTYGEEVEKVELNGHKLTEKQYKISDLLDMMNSAASQVATYALGAEEVNIPLDVTYKTVGTHAFKMEVKNVEGALICQDSVNVTIAEEQKPDDGKKDDTKPENPVTTYALTVKDGTVKVNGKDVAANESGAYAVEKDAKVEVTFDKTTLSDAQVFDQWTITPASVLNEVDPKSETISFTMPAEEVTIKAMTRDATIEDDGPGVLGTAAMIGVGVAGTAVLGYQGYMIGTELYLKNVMPAGAAIPTNTAELAKLVWNDAGCPEPVALLAADATDEQKALTWAVENQLISADKAADASVTRWEVIQTWNQEQEMKKA